MSYTVEDKLPVKFFKDTITKKTDMIEKSLKEANSTLIVTRYIGSSSATLQFYSTKDDKLKLQYTFSNLGDLEDQLYFLWIQLKYVLWEG